MICLIGWHRWRKCEPIVRMNVKGRYCKKCLLRQEFEPRTGKYFKVGYLDEK